LAVGVVGYFAPLTLGVGYSNITHLLEGKQAMQVVAVLCIMKFISWSISLGSGTSGGTLAPLFTIGGALGALLGAGAQLLFPQAGVDIRIAALVGMAAIFAGATRALLASVVFAFETTLQPLGLLPLLGGCTASFLVSCLLMKQTIMTEKIVRRGVRVPAEYEADYLDQILVSAIDSPEVIALQAQESLGHARAWVKSCAAGTAYKGFPILDENQVLVGVLTRHDLLDAPEPDGKPLRDLIRRPPVIVYDDCTLREAADHMVNHNVGRLPVIARKPSGKLVGMITRSDLLSAHRRRLDQKKRSAPTIAFGFK
jgi:chloride channel protein, CIC family